MVLPLSRTVGVRGVIPEIVRTRVRKWVPEGETGVAVLARDGKAKESRGASHDTSV